MSGRTVLITGASSGIGRATALKVAAAGGVPLLVARGVDKLEEARAEIIAGGGTAYVYAADLSDIESIESLIERVLADHRHVDMLVNNAGRSIRRSIALSYDRFHDFERTIQLNYFGAVKLIIGAAAAHARARLRATSSTSPRSASRRTRRASRPTSPRRRRSTRSRASSPRR